MNLPYRAGKAIKKSQSDRLLAKKMGFVDYISFLPLEQCIQKLYLKESFNSPCFPRGTEKIDPDQVNLLKKRTSFFKKLIYDDTCFVFPYIPDKKIEGAQNSYASGVESDDILCLVDLTIMGGGEEGFIVTKDTLYSINGKKPVKIELSEIRSISQKEDGALHYIYVNRKQFAPCSGSSEKQKSQERFISAVLELAKFTQQTTPGKSSSKYEILEQFYNSLKINNVYDCLAARDMLREKAKEISYGEYTTLDSLAGLLEEFQQGVSPSKNKFPKGNLEVDQQKVRLWKKRLSFFEHIEDKRFFKTPRIRPDFLNSALKSFATAAKEEDVIALFEDTLFGRGGKGFLITTTCIYAGTSEMKKEHSLLKPAKFVFRPMERFENLYQIWIDDKVFCNVDYGDEEICKNIIAAINKLVAFNCEYIKCPFISANGNLYESEEKFIIDEKLRETFNHLFADIDVDKDSLTIQENKAIKIRIKLQECANELGLKSYTGYDELEKFIATLDIKIRTVGDTTYATREEADEAKKVFALETFFEELKKRIEAEKSLEDSEAKAVAARAVIQEKQKELQLKVTDSYEPLECLINDLDVKIRTVGDTTYATREEADKMRADIAHEKLVSNRKTYYVLLAIFLGSLGIHDFYAGKKLMGGIKLAISIISGGSLVWISFVWGIADVFIACRKKGFFDTEWRKAKIETKQ